MRKALAGILLLCFFGFLGIRPLLHPGFFTSLDGWHNIARLFHYHQALLDSQFPPRWVGMLAHGLGYPLFIFSYHAPWLIGEPFLRLGVGVIDGVKLILALGFVLSGLLMYFWIKDSYGFFPGLVTGIVYMWTPYRFAKIFVGASVGEATAFLFLPLLLWGFYRLKRNPRALWVGVGAVGLAGIILSHLMLIPLMAYFLLLLTFGLYLSASHKRAFIISVLSTFILGLGLACYYWLPAGIYSHFIKAKTEGAGFANLYENHLVHFSQLVYSKWGFGPIISKATDGEISFQLGFAAWGGLLLSLFLLIKQPLEAFIPKLSKLKLAHNDQLLLLMWVVAAVIGIFAMTTHSLIVWKRVSQFITLDYPWRLLTLTTLIGAYLSGYCVYAYKNSGKFLGIFFIAISLYSNRNHVRVNEYTNVPLSLYVVSETTTNTFAEYLPVWVKVDINKENVPLVDPSSAVAISNSKRNTRELSFDADSQKAEELKINYLYFPGQTVYIDRVQSKYSYQSDGRIFVPISNGSHHVQVVFEQTPIMKVANLISIISLAVLCGIFLYTAKSRHPSLLRK